ncbi:MAG: hypothetical protein M3350_05575 [Actinomycetota bacterium]|nr:hypothetical protein [Actinomycetota bacterium]MDQ3720237.1 hypothetical protein [Actinomycetota bacterium]
MPDGQRTRRFWDDRARKNALFFVDNQLRYADPDTERFFAQTASTRWT